MRGLTSAAIALSMLWTCAAHADTLLLTLSFDHIVETGDGAIQLANGETGEEQFFVDVIDNGIANQVKFTFRNTGPDPSFIDGVYFDDGTLLGISSIVNGAGVKFTAGARPSDLPGGGLVGFEVTANFSADRDGTAIYGVNPGEYVSIVFDLTNGQDAMDAVDALFLPTGTVGSLRVGIKAQGFTRDGSESFVSNPPSGNPNPPGGTPIVPVPAAVWGGAALFGAVAVRKAKRP